MKPITLSYSGEEFCPQEYIGQRHVENKNNDENIADVHLPLD